MMHMNIRSMKANIDLFTAYLDTLEFRFKLIAFTETSLDNNNNDLYNIPGYNIISNLGESQQVVVHQF